MWVVSLISIAIIGWYVSKRLRCSGTRCEIAWSHFDCIAYPAALVCDVLDECFGTADRTYLEDGSTINVYLRGDPKAMRVSDPHKVRFCDIPSCFSVTVVPSELGTLVSLRIGLHPKVRISPSAAKFFEPTAQDVFVVAVERMKRAAAQRRYERKAQKQNMPGAVASGDGPDYVTLGVKPGATLEQVKAAYRDACRKYHPDRLSGQNVEPQLVELAVQRFKEVSAAYRRLKDHLAQPQHT
ncbi:MAG: hypothetical protein BroJett003_01800 [Planctomycetota bacterium]|nr:MAG: hypothetical protein BroJett003_01800 [Planctomycetota bacterium]